MESMGGFGLEGGLGGFGFGGMDGAPDLESMLAGLDPDGDVDPAAMMNMLRDMGGMGGLGDLGGLDGFGGFPGLDGDLSGSFFSRRQGAGLGRGLGRASRADDFDDFHAFGPPSRSFASPASTHDELTQVRPGDRVAVVLGRSSSGMQATVHQNDAQGKFMLVLPQGEDEPRNFPYKNLAVLDRRGEINASAGPSNAQISTASSGLAEVASDSRVRVIAGRQFAKFRGGMEGRVVKNNLDCRNMLVQFDDVSFAGTDPLQVAYKHLEVA